MKCNGLLSVKKVFITMVLFVVLVLAAPPAYADILSPDVDINLFSGMDINVKYDNKKIDEPVFYATILGCYPCDFEKGACNPLFIPEGNHEVEQLRRISEYDAEKKRHCLPTKSEGSGRCTNGHCWFGSIDQSEIRLALYMPGLDRTFISDIIYQKNRYSSYEANILPNGAIEMKETTLFFMTPAAQSVINYMVALIITIIIELLVVIAYFNLDKSKIDIFSKKRNRVLSSLILVNIVSLSLIWFSFLLFFSVTSSLLTSIIFLESFVVLFEGGIIYLFNRGVFTPKGVLFLSMIMNASSFIAGGFIYMILGIIF